ncbi:MAG: DUF5320 domain-containing protein [archaeon]
MSGKDGTGPRGEGPCTGRGFGKCKCENQGSRGAGRGLGRGKDRGKGFGRRFSEEKE